MDLLNPLHHDVAGDVVLGPPVLHYSRLVRYSLWWVFAAKLIRVIFLASDANTEVS